MHTKMTVYIDYFAIRYYNNVIANLKGGTTMKSKSIALLVVSFLLIGVLNFVAFFGITVGGAKYPGVLDTKNGLKLGIDLAGGSTIVFQANAKTVTADQMNVVSEVLRKRLDSAGYTEAKITVGELDSRNVTVEIPAITDVDSAVKLLGETAKLTFKDSDGNVILDGAKDVKTANSRYGQTDQTSASQYYVELQFTKTGQPKFADATKKAAAKAEGKNYITINLDEKVVSQASVKEEIDSDSAIISGKFSQTEADTLANQVKSGQLPFNLKVVSKSTVGPELGDTALASSFYAGLLGFLLVILFMLLIYRLSGLVASIALCCYVGLMMLCIGLFGINLSLPGIAGIILGVGMAVDANIIIFERMKEEIRLGKTIRASVDAGFKRALRAIIDSNVTTLIAAAVLYFFGTGPIKGFAVTLFLGVVLSMITAISVTKFLLKEVVGLQLTDPKLYGVKKKKEAVENV
jgi:protein-export membrane protein, SecD/SecF family